MIVTLASASPRRKELISQIKWINCNIIPSGADESKIKNDNPIELTKALALTKAQEVYTRCGGVVLGADTVVVVDGRILGKPQTESEATQFLKLLCGRAHQVITAVAVVSEKKTLVDCEISTVYMRPYDEEWAKAYIATKSPFDKAGGYGIQDEAFAPILEKFDGELDNIIGLPVKLTEKLLQEIAKTNGND